MVSFRPVFALALLGCFLAPLKAHDLYRSESRLEVRGREVKATMTFNLLDFAGVDQNGDKVVSQAEFDQAFDRVYAAILQHFSIQSSGPSTRMTRETYKLFAEHVLDLQLLYVFPQQVLALEVDSSLPEVCGSGHIHLTTVVLNGKVQEGILDARNRKAFFTAGGGSNLHTFQQFLVLGMEHIATGYDHLSFLLGLLIATSSLRSLVKVVTSFTVAHSITLALATFDIVVLPSRFTESAIAASIVYVAVENLIRGRAIERDSASRTCCARCSSPGPTWRCRCSRSTWAWRSGRWCS